jgi:CRP/FNR family cyclic AMP-dependent transcriptional regulator
MGAKDSTTVEIRDFLKAHPLFSELEAGSVRSLARACRFKTFDKGERLFWEADPAECAYVIRSGQVSVVLNSPDGREMAIDVMRSGDILGELGLLTRKTHSAGALVKTRTEALVIPRETFLLVLDHEPAMARRLLEITADRLHKSASREMALAFMDAQARLARHLLALSEAEKEKGYITASQEELAQATGLIRQTVAKALGQWRRDGWLLTGRGRIVLLNLKALRQVEHGKLT